MRGSILSNNAQKNNNKKLNEFSKLDIVITFSINAPDVLTFRQGVLVVHPGVALCVVSLSFQTLVESVQMLYGIW